MHELPPWLDLTGRRALVIGIANDHSIAYGCAQMLTALGADLGVTYLNAKAEPHVRPLAEALGASLIAPLDVEVPGQLEAVFDQVRTQWGRLDFLLHAIAFAPRDCLHERVLDCQWRNFQRAMDVSCHSFVRAARQAEPLMDRGGAIVTLSYYGAEKAVPEYKVMGPVKAALESFVRYLALELAQRKVRVYAVPGPDPHPGCRRHPGLRSAGRARARSRAIAPAGAERGSGPRGCGAGRRCGRRHDRQHHPCRCWLSHRWMSDGRFGPRTGERDPRGAADRAVGDLRRQLMTDDIALFAALSDDINPTHLDPDFARHTAQHEVIAHGMWAAALVSAVLGTRLPGPGTVYFGQTLTFERSVRVDDTLTVLVSCAAKGVDGTASFDCL